VFDELLRGLRAPRPSSPARTHDLQASG